MSMHDSSSGFKADGVFDGKGMEGKHKKHGRHMRKLTKGRGGKSRTPGGIKTWFTGRVIGGK